MKRNSLLLITLVFLVLQLTSACKPKSPAPKTLKDLIQGATWRLGTVTKGTTSVTSDFTGFTFTIASNGTSGTIVTGGTNSQTVAGTYNIATNTITLSSGIPTNWASSLTAASANTDGTTFTFKVTITSPKTGAAEYTFSLVK